MKILFLTLNLLLSFFTIHGQARGDKNDKTITPNESYSSSTELAIRAREYMNSDRNEQGIKLLNEAIAKNPSNPLIMFVRAEYQFYHFEDYKFALALTAEVLDRISKRDSLYQHVLLLRAQSHTMLGDKNAALSDYRSLLTNDSTHYAALMNYGVTLGDLGDEETAILYYKKVLALYPEDPHAFLNLGYSSTELGDYEAGVEYSLKALQLYENEMMKPVILNNLGYATAMGGDLDKGIDYINRAIELYPENSYAYRNKGLLYLRQNDYKSGCDHLQKAISLGYPEENLKEYLKNCN